MSTTAAIAAGYRTGPAADPPFPTAFDADSLVADAFVDFYWTGSHSPGPDRRSGLEEITRLHALPGFIVPWYRAGLA